MVCILQISLSGCQDDNEQLLEKEFLGNYTYTPEDYYRTYDGIADSLRSDLLIDDFTDNNNNWYVTSGQQGDNYCFIQGGNLVFGSNITNSYLNSLSLQINTSLDFEIEASMKISRSSETNYNGVIWGGDFSAGVDFYTMMFNASQNSWLGYTEGGNYVPWQDFTTGNVNGIFNENLFTVRKVDDTYYFFINKVFIKSETFLPFFGNQIGFKVGAHNEIQVDYLKVYYLDL